VDAAFFNSSHRGLIPSFSSSSLNTSVDLDASWRKEILQRLRSRDQQESNNFEMYEEAISQVCPLFHLVNNMLIT